MSLERADVGAVAAGRIRRRRIIKSAAKSNAALIGGQAAEVLATVNRRTAKQQRVSEGRAAVAMQRAEHRISVDLVCSASQNAAAIVAAEIVAERRDGAEVVEYVFARSASVQDGAANLDGRAIKATIVVDAAAVD